ncbi:major facilitator superfamily domain-containing protein [Phlebopus sp. FC_14]|nr:major facilitator superfamily domain-containing protein [Phlebopus sp. FC_14]
MTGFSSLPLAEEDGVRERGRWAGVARIIGPPWARLPSLTVGLLGVQVLWSVEMSYASPYLLSLGLTKSWMAVVFLAGPLAGLIVQPMIGILADNSTSRFGRRRPLILAGTFLCCLATLLLGFTRPVASIFISPNSPSNDVLTIWFAVLSIYCIDFSINAVQALDRALLVDTLPTSEQPSGNAWAARMLAIGSVAGFFVGNVDLPLFFPFFGSVQLEVLAVIASFLMLMTHFCVSSCVKERVLLSSSQTAKSLREEITQLWCTLLHLPKAIRQICFIQFFAWLAWFPVLFYTTVYIGELHKKASATPEDDDAAIALDIESTRLGTRALFYSALVSLAANIVLPLFVVSPQEPHKTGSMQPLGKTWFERLRIQLSTLWALSHLIFALCMAATFITTAVSSATFIMSVTGFCWAVTQWAPFALLAEAILSPSASDEAGSILLTNTRSGRMARLSDEIDTDETRQLFNTDLDDEEEDQEEDAADVYTHVHTLTHPDNSSPSTSRSASPEHDREHDHDHTHASHSGITVIDNSRARVSRIDFDFPASPPSASRRVDTGMTSSGSPGRKESNSLGSQAGAILGIHNLFIVIPQFLVTGLSSIVFAIFDPEKSVLHGHHPGNTQSGNETIPTAQDVTRPLLPREELPDLPDDRPNSVAIIFRLGGISAAIAFILCWRLSKELKRH